MILKQMGSTVGDSKKMGKEEQRQADEHAGFFLMEIHTSRDGFNSGRTYFFRSRDQVCRLNRHAE